MMMEAIELAKRGISPSTRSFTRLHSVRKGSPISGLVSTENPTDDPTSAPSPSDGKSEQVPQLSVVGGLIAWLQVLGAFCLFFTSWGIVNSFGVYQTYYESNLLTSSSSSQISWIGSMQAFLLLAIGFITGPILDRGYLRTLLLVGSFLTVFGFMMTSICKDYWQVLLAQGLCIGLGSGCLFIPSIAVVPAYFTTKRAFATGIAVGGSSIGGIIYPITFRQLQPKIGFGWATRVLAFITLVLLIIPIAVMRTRLPPRPPRSLFQISALKVPTYTIQAIGVTVGFIGLYVPMFYIGSYSLARVHTNENYAFYLLSILNAGSFFGRIVPNFFADKTGPLNMLAPCTIASGILCLVWIDIKSAGAITVFALLYGFFAGAFVSLIPPVVVELVPDMSVVGTWMGMSLFIGSWGLLVGNPIAGAFVDIPKKYFAASQGFAGGIILLGGAFILGARTLRAREVRKWRV